MTGAVTHVQSPSRDVSSGDEGLGLFGFDLSSAETGFWWLEEEQEEKSKYMASISAEEAGDLSVAPDELDHACRDARD